MPLSCGLLTSCQPNLGTDVSNPKGFSANPTFISAIDMYSFL